jgi:hypothetical protein
MSLSTCDYCGGHISLGPCQLNRCESCGLGVIERDPLPPVGALADSELVSLRKEVAKLRAENAVLLRIERNLWRCVGRHPKQLNEGEGVNKSFGTRRPGDF